jgi:hypothetical protein
VLVSPPAPQFLNLMTLTNEVGGDLKQNVILPAKARIPP